MAINANSIDRARQAGYNDAEIIDHIASLKGYKGVPEARSAGYSDMEILGHLRTLEDPVSTPTVIPGAEKTGTPGIAPTTLPKGLGGGPAGYQPPTEEPSPYALPGAGLTGRPGIPEVELPVGLGGTKAPFSTAYDPYKRVGRALPNQVFGAPLKTDVGELAKLKAKVAPGYLPDDDTVLQGFMGEPKPEPLSEDPGYVERIQHGLRVGSEGVVSSALSGGEALARRAAVALPKKFKPIAERAEWELAQANAGRPEMEPMPGSSVQELAADSDLTLNKVGKYAVGSTAQAIPSIGATVIASMLPGGKIAGPALSYLMSVGELYENNVNKGVHPDEAATIAGLGGGPSAALDYLEPFRIKAALTGKTTKALIEETYKKLGILRRAGKATAEGLVESGTEMGQELIAILSEWYGTGKAPGLNESLWRLGESGAGAFGAGGIGGGVQQVSEARHNAGARAWQDYLEKEKAARAGVAPMAPGGPVPAPGAPAEAAPAEGEVPPPGAAPPGAAAAGPAADTAPPRPLFDSPEDLYQDATQFAGGFRQLGVTALSQKYGITKDEAHAILERFVEDGLFAAKPLKGGGVSYVNLALQREAREIDPATGQRIRSPITKKGALEEAAGQFIPPGEGAIAPGEGPAVEDEEAPLAAAPVIEQPRTEPPPLPTQQAPPPAQQEAPPQEAGPQPDQADLDMIYSAPLTQEQQAWAVELLGQGHSVEDAMEIAHRGEEAPAAPAPVQAKEEAPQRPEPLPSASEQAPPPAPAAPEVQQEPLAAAKLPEEQQAPAAQAPAPAVQEPLEAAKPPEQAAAPTGTPFDQAKEHARGNKAIKADELIQGFGLTADEAHNVLWDLYPARMRKEKAKAIAAERRSATIEARKAKAGQPEQKPGPTPAPWEMTLEEVNQTGYIARDVNAGNMPIVRPATIDAGTAASNASEHKRVVAEAVAQGKPVPAKVLAEYPDLVAIDPAVKAAIKRRERERAKAAQAAAPKTEQQEPLAAAKPPEQQQAPPPPTTQVAAPSTQVEQPLAAAKPIEKEAPSGTEAKAEEDFALPAGDESTGGQALQRGPTGGREGAPGGERREGGVQGRTAEAVEGKGELDFSDVPLKAVAKPSREGFLERLKAGDVRGMSVEVMGAVARGLVKAEDAAAHMVKTYGAKAKAYAKDVAAQVQEWEQNPARLEEMEASTALPKGKNKTVDPITGLAVTGYNNAIKDPSAFAKAIALMNKYVNFADINEATPEATAEKMIQRIVDNLLFLHDKYKELGFSERARLWYDGGRKKVLANAEEYGINEFQSAAVLAVFSPEKDWFQNVDMARRMLEWWKNRKTLKWTPQMDAIYVNKILPAKRNQDKNTAKKREAKYLKDRAEFPAKVAEWRKANREARLAGTARPKRPKRPERKPFEPSTKVTDALAAIQGKGASEIKSTYQQAVWFRLWDEAHNSRNYQIISPEGEYTGLAMTEAKEGKVGKGGKIGKAKEAKPAKVAWSSYNPMVKALMVLKDGSFENISRQVGQRHKVRNFYNNLLDPENPNGHVTSDTHAVAAGLMRPLGGSALEVEHNLGKGVASARTGESGTYWMFAEAYRRAARERHLLPREMQSITWEAVRGLYKNLKSKANKDRVVEIWNEVNSGKITPGEAREKIYKEFNGIDTPAWAGSGTGRGRDTAVDEGRGGAKDEEGVLRLRLPGPGSGGASVGGGGGGSPRGLAARVNEGIRKVGDALRARHPASTNAAIGASLAGSDYTFKTGPGQTGTVYANPAGIEFIGHLTNDPHIGGINLPGKSVDNVLTFIDSFVNGPNPNRAQLAKLQPLYEGMEKWRQANPGTDVSLNFAVLDNKRPFAWTRQTAREELIHGFQRLKQVTRAARETILKTPVFEKARLDLIRQGYGDDVEIRPGDTADEKAQKHFIAWMEITAKVLSGDTLGLTISEREDVAYAYREALIAEHGDDAVLVFRYLKAGSVKDVFLGKKLPGEGLQRAQADLQEGEAELQRLLKELQQILDEEKAKGGPLADLDFAEVDLPHLTEPEGALRARQPQQPPQQPQTTQALATTTQQQQGQQQSQQGPQQPRGAGPGGTGPTVAQRFDQTNAAAEHARQSDEKTRMEKFKEGMKFIGTAFTRQFHHIPAGALYAEFKQKLNFVSKSQGNAIHKAAQAIIDQLEKLDPDEYTQFLHVVLYDDLAARVIQSIKEKKPILAKDLPLGIQDAREVINFKTEARNRVRGNPKIVEALRQRKAMWDKIKPEYVAAMRRAGVDVSKAVARKDYFRHRVIKHQKAKELIGGGGTGAGQRFKLPTARSWMKKAEVNANTYSLDYIRSEFEVLSEMMYDTERANFIGWLKNDSGHNISSQLKRMAAAHNKAEIMPTFARMARHYNQKNPRAPRMTAEMAYQKVMKMRPRDPSWRTRVTKRMAGAEYVGSLEAAYNKLTLPNGNKALDTHALYQANEKDHFFLAATIPDSLAAAIEANGQGRVTADKIRKIKAKGARQGQMVLPREVIETMKEFMQPPSTKWGQFVDKWSRKPLAWWKQSKLIHPVAVIKYNLRNLSGDLERVLITNPYALKHVGRSMDEIRKFMKTGHPPSPEFEAWWERGGMDANLQVAEIGEVNRLQKLVHLKLKDPKLGRTEKGFDKAGKAWDAVWNTTRKMTDFREGILRYATFLEYQKQIAASGTGKPNNFGASIREEVMALRNMDDRAYKLSNDLMLAYDEVSVAGQTLRRHFIPFWSFQEKNLGAYKRMVVNSYKDGRTSAAIGYAALGASASALRVGLWTAAKIGKTLTLAMALKALTEIWNNYVMDDEEEDLPEGVKKSTHLILGRDSNGKVIAFTRLGTADDILEWGGLEAAPYYVREFLNNRMTYEDLAKEIALRPFGIPLPIKPAINKVAQSIHPGIKTTAEYVSGRAWFPNVFDQREIRDRYEYIARELGMTAVYKAAARKPQPKFWTPERVLDLMVYRYDPKETHYNSFKYDKVAKWGAEHGADPGGGLSQKKAAAALYDLRMAVRYNDDRARDAALVAYGEAGGTQQNLKKSIERLHPLGTLKKALWKDFEKSLSKPEAAQLKKAIQFWEENFHSKVAQIEGAASRQGLPEKRKRGK